MLLGSSLVAAPAPSNCAECDVFSSANLGGVSEQDLQLIDGYGVTWLCFTAQFILPSAIKGVLYVITCIYDRRVQSALARTALTLLCFACAAFAALFLLASFSFIIQVDSESAATVPGQQYVAFLPTPVPSIDFQAADSTAASAENAAAQHSIDLALLFLLQRDREDASNIFEAALIGGFLEVLIPIIFLVPVAILVFFRRCSANFGECCFPGMQTLPLGTSSRDPSSRLGGSSTIGSTSPVGRGIVSCVEPSHIAIDILSKLGHMLVGLIRVLVLALVLALLAGFLLGPLVYTSLRQPGFGGLWNTGLGGLVPINPNTTVEGLGECPEVHDVVDHYVRHVFWADVESSASGDRGFELKESSFSHLVFGTVNVTSAAHILWDMHCYIDPAEDLKRVGTHGVVFPVEEVLECECSDWSLSVEMVALQLAQQANCDAQNLPKSSGF